MLYPRVLPWFVFALLAGTSLWAADPPRPARSLREYRDFAMSRDGNPRQGRDLFFSEKAACFKCHSIDGTASKAGPDLIAAGDKFPRRDLIQAILEPSAAIAVGYGATIVEKKNGDELTGILKQVTDSYIELIGADGKTVHISTTDIQGQRGSKLSLMPEGVHQALSLQEFADLVQFLTTLREPANAVSSNEGMPDTIPMLANPVAIQPFFSEELRFPHSFVHAPGDVRSGLIWFTQIPGMSNAFLVVHQTGKIWLLEKRPQQDLKTLFADFGPEL